MSQVLSGSLTALVSRFRLRRARNAALEHARRLIGRSDLFDAEWYLERYTDVAKVGQNPLDHFILHGGTEGRSPGPRFDSRWYLRHHPDVARSGANPLVHYLDHGRGEGRSIKAFGADSNGNTEGMLQGDKKSPPPPNVPPYVSDYDLAWKARTCDWLALSEQGRRNSSPASEDAADLLSGMPEGTARDRIAFFLSLDQGFETPAEQQDLAQTGLGLGPIADGWFAHSRLLLLRMSEEVTDTSRVVGFQRGNDGALHRVTTQVSVAISGVIRLELENPLGPVLLVWQRPDGSPVEASLVLFPSLYRGGMHQIEALAVAGLRDGSTSIADYMMELAGDLFGHDPLLLGRIIVQLRGANGSEPIFQPAVVDGLASHFGVTMVTEAHLDLAHSPAERLRSTAALAGVAERRQTASDLLLPSDCMPSLAALSSLASSQRVGASALAIAPQGRAEHAVLLCLPQSNAATEKMAHPALPHAAQVWRSTPAGSALPLAQAGLPSALRMMDSTVWQVDPLLPLSLDVAVPKSADVASVPPTVRVILSHTGTPQELILSAAAISAQIGVKILEIQLLTEKSDLPALDDCDLPLRIISPAQLSVARRDKDDQATLVIFSDTAVFAHDPRTFAMLADLCRAQDNGAATCAVVTSLSEEEAEVRSTVSWIADCTASAPLPADDMIAGLVPAATFDVAAGDPRIVAIRGEVWDSLLVSTAVPKDASDMVVAVASKCQDKGLATVATTLVRVATSRAELTLPAQAAALPELFANAKSRETATHLIRLMP